MRTYRRGLSKGLPRPILAVNGEAILRRRYRRLFGYSLDVSDPQTFTEKLYCRMIQWHWEPDRLAIGMADKHTLREHVAARVGIQHVMPLLWYSHEAVPIPFGSLPERFIVKASHGCKYVIRVDRSSDHDSVAREAWAFLQRNFYWTHREPQYLDLRATLMVEPWLDDGHPSGPIDYMAYCFDGTPVVISTGDRRARTFAYQDPSWSLLDIHKTVRASHQHVERPDDLTEMLDVATRMARGFDFVRVDMLRVAGEIYVNEMTFTPSAGRSRFKPPGVESWLGGLWHPDPFSRRATLRGRSLRHLVPWRRRHREV